MSPNQENKDNLEYIFTRIFDNLDRIVERIDKSDDLNSRTFQDLRDEIRRAKDESKRFLEHVEILITLGQNLSAEGLKELISDVQMVKNYVIAHKASAEVSAKIRDEIKSDEKTRTDYYWKIAMWLLGALLIGLGWLLKSYLVVLPHTP